MPLYGDGRSGTYSATVTQFGGYKSPASPTTVAAPPQSRVLSQPSVTPTISDAVSAISGLSARWRADQIIGVSNGAGVATWPDASGYGYAATQATAQFQPTYQASAINGQPTLRFTASALSHFNSPAPAGSPEQTVVAVIKTTLTGAAQTIRAGGADVDPNGAGALHFRIEASGAPGLVEQNIAGIGNGTTAISTTPVAVAATFSDSGNSYAFYLDGTATGSGSATNTLQARTTRIGLHAAGTEGFNGDIAELIVWDRVLTGPELATVQTYIADRYLGAPPEVHTTAGTATAAASASASTTTTRTKTGAAAAAATATRIGSSVRTKTATAGATATATSTTAAVRTKTGTATATATGSGTTATTRPKTGTATATATATRAGSSVRVKTGTAQATATATGTTSSTFVEIHTTAGTATATATASATKTTTRTTARTATATASATRVGSTARTTARTAVATATVTAATGSGRVTARTATATAVATSSTSTVRSKTGVATLTAGSTALSTTWRTGSGTATAYATASGLTAQGSGYRDITLSVGPGRSRTLTAAGQSRTLAAVVGPPRTLAATGRSRDLAATGRSRSLHAEPRE